MQKMCIYEANVFKSTAQEGEVSVFVEIKVKMSSKMALCHVSLNIVFLTPNCGDSVRNLDVSSWLLMKNQVS